MNLRSALGNAVDAGLRFLLASQSETGYWSDWQLPPGESRMWTTAYAGYRLSGLREPLCDPAQRALRLAAAWLASAELEEGGWGYDEEVGPDADSTALAILFLSSQRARVAARSYERLRTFQRDDGGFSTYTYEQNFGAWVASHPDVTAMAIPALLTHYEISEACVTRAIEYAIAQGTPEGLWNSYWWNTPLYATEANLRWLIQTGRPFPAATAGQTLVRMRPANAFERALLVLSLLHIGCALDAMPMVEAIRTLLGAQLSGGSWPSEPILRLPARDCYQPWAASESAPRFADQHRIFTSATVIAALAAAWNRSA